MSAFLEILLLGVYYCVSREEYTALKATRNVRAACETFKCAIARNDVSYQNARRELLSLEKELAACTYHLKTALRNVLSAKSLELHLRGESKQFKTQDLILWLSAADLEVYERVKLLNIRLSVARTNLQCLANIDRTLQTSYQKAVNLLASLDLRATVRDVTGIIGDVKLSGLSEVTERLALDVDTLLSTTTGLDFAFDVEASGVESALKPLKAGEQKVDHSFWDSLLSSVDTVRKVVTPTPGDENMLKKAIL